MKFLYCLAVLFGYVAAVLAAIWLAYMISIVFMFIRKDRKIKLLERIDAHRKLDRRSNTRMVHRGVLLVHPVGR